MRQFYRCLSIALVVAFCATLISTPPAAAEDAAAVAVQAASAAQPVQVAQANPFSDVPENSWAYDAVRQLAAAGLVTGYPDNTFKGNRPMTRYEMAVLVNRAVNAIQSKIAGGSQVKQSDLDAIKKLVDAFGPELREVQAQLRALQAQQATLKTSVDAVKAQNDQLSKKLAADEIALRSATETLAGSHAGYSFWERVYTGSQQASLAQQGAGVPPPTAATNSLAWGTLGGNASVPTGPVGRMFEYHGARFNLSGAADPRIQFAMRMESLYRSDQLQSGTVGTTPGYCTVPTNTSALYNCQTQDYTGGIIPGVAGASLPARVAYSWVGYFSPGGFFLKAGRLGQDEGLMADGIALGGASINGAQAGYKTSRFYTYVMGTTDGTAISNLGLIGVNAVNSANGLGAGAAAAASGAGPLALCPFGNPGNFAATGGVAKIAGGSTANLAAGQGAGYGSAADCMNQGSNGVIGLIEYYFPTSGTVLGFTYDGYNAVPYNGWNPYAGLCTGAVGAAKPGTSVTSGAGVSTWNTAVVGSNGFCPSGFQPLVYAPGSPNAGAPVTGGYQTVVTNIKTSSIYGIQYFGPHSNPTFRLAGEYLWRWGQDPFSAANPASGGIASNWKDNGYGFVELAYNSKGRLASGPLIPGTNVRNSNAVVLQYYNQGLNAQGLDNGVGGALSAQSTTFYTNYAGTNEVALFLQHWFTPNLRAGLSYFVFSNRGIPIPASSTTCPTCTVSGLVTRAIGFDSYLVW